MKRLLPVCISVIAFLFSMGVCAQQPAADAVLTAMQQELDRSLANLKKTPTPPYFLSSITVVSRSPHPSARLPAVPIKPHAISTSIFAWETTRGVGAACPKPGAPSVHVIDANRRKTENRMGNNRVTSFSHPGFSTGTSMRSTDTAPRARRFCASHPASAICVSCNASSLQPARHNRRSEEYPDDAA